MLSEAERRIMILDYVRENSDIPKITKAQIMVYMREVSRGMTTYKITIELIKEGKIKMVKPKDKPYSEIDYLVINEENEFNKIYKFLSEIEKIIDGMDETLDKISKETSIDNPNKEFMELAEDLRLHLSLSYREGIYIILQELIGITNNKIRSEKDSQIIYTKIVELLRKITLQQWYPGFKDTIKQLDSVSRSFKHVKPSPLTKTKNINVELANRSNKHNKKVQEGISK